MFTSFSWQFFGIAISTMPPFFTCFFFYLFTCFFSYTNKHIKICENQFWASNKNNGQFTNHFTIFFCLHLCFAPTFHFHTCKIFIPWKGSSLSLSTFNSHPLDFFLEIIIIKYEMHQVDSTNSLSKHLIPLPIAFFENGIKSSC